jgi:hypothetical protein
MGFMDRLKHGWNAITADEERQSQHFEYGANYVYRSDRGTYSRNSAGDRSILAAIYNRIAIDVASIPIRHIRLDEKGRYKEEMDSGLNERLNLEANLDQGARQFRQDIAQTLFDKGVCAIVAVETSGDPLMSGSVDIRQLRVGEIVQWYPAHVRVSLYDQRTGTRKEVTLLKQTVAIVENPLYNVMNEPNGTLQRLIRKLALLDSVDEQSSNGKLDMIVQLPYQIRSETRQAQANMRRKNLEEQLRDSKYGIGYIDATEKITQLNRPIENNMLKQIEYLTGQLYAQLGITAAVFDGSASVDQMLNYQNRTVEPILTAIVEAMKRTFLTRTARTQKQTIAFFQDPFKLLPIDKIAEIGDKFTRNEIMSSNEIRDKLGLPPADDPKADTLTNSNLYSPDGTPMAGAAPADGGGVQDSIVNDTFDKLSESVNKILGSGDSDA